MKNRGITHHRPPLNRACWQAGKGLFCYIIQACDILQIDFVSRLGSQKPSYNVDHRTIR